MHTLGQPVSGPEVDEMIKEADTDCKFIFLLWVLRIKIHFWFLINLGDGRVDFDGKNLIIYIWLYQGEIRKKQNYLLNIETNTAKINIRHL